MGATVGAALACAAAVLCLFWCAYASFRERRAQIQHSPQAWMHAMQAAQAAKAELTPPLATEEQQQAYYAQQSHKNAAIFLERADARRKPGTVVMTGSTPSLKRIFSTSSPPKLIVAPPLSVLEIMTEHHSESSTFS